jgi:hypothetical protein
MIITKVKIWKEMVKFSFNYYPRFYMVTGKTTNTQPRFKLGGERPDFHPVS